MADREHTREERGGRDDAASATTRVPRGTDKPGATRRGTTRAPGESLPPPPPPAGYNPYFDLPPT